jgi:U6 snRNA-associated Sm-like protein LSm8
VQILTAEGRTFTGILRGIDQVLNSVLESCQERIYSPNSPMQTVDLGLYIIRGELIAVIGTTELTSGEFDVEAEKEIDMDGLRGDQLPRITV